MTGMAGHDPGISGHVRPESLVTLLRNTHLIPYVGILANAVMYLMPGSPQDNDHGEKPRTGNGLVAVLVVLAYATSLFAYFRMRST